MGRGKPWRPIMLWAPVSIDEVSVQVLLDLGVVCPVELVDQFLGRHVPRPCAAVDGAGSYPPAISWTKRAVMTLPLSGWPPRVLVTADQPSE